MLEVHLSHLSRPFTQQESLSLFSRVLFSLTGPNMFPPLPVCLKAWTLTHLPCVLSAAVCVAIGWHQKRFFSCSIGARPVPVALAESKLQTQEEVLPDGTSGTTSIWLANLCLHAQNRIMLSLSSRCERVWFLGVHVKRRIGIFWNERPTQYFLQMLFLSFRHFHIRNILYVPVRRRDKETHGCDVGNKTCQRLGFGSRVDQEQKSCTIFKIANNEGGEWRERQRGVQSASKATSLQQERCRSMCRFTKIPGSSTRNTAVQTKTERVAQKSHSHGFLYKF